MSASGPPEDPVGHPPDGSHPHVLVHDLDAPALDDDALHHLRRVRRLRDGDRCTVTDGSGAWRWCVLRQDADLEVDGPVRHVPPPAAELTVAFALTKGERPDWTVQKLTELGIDRIVPFRADRSVVRWDPAKAAKQLDRLRAIARAAFEQSRRCWLPVVEPLTDAEGLVGIGAIRMDRGAPPPTLAQRVVAIGPEGGWSPRERELLPEAAGLGRNVLRAETAALTAGAVIVSLRSGIVAPVGRTAHGSGKPGL